MGQHTMKLVLLSLNYAPELTGIGKYNGELCADLTQRGLDVTAIVAPPYYPEWQVHSGFRKLWYATDCIDGVKIHRCPTYVPSKVTALKRIIHLVSFSVSALFPLIWICRKRPDVFLVIQPTLFCAPMTLICAKIMGSKCILHIQDFEIDALYGLNSGGENILARVARRIESWLMNRFDMVTTISHSMLSNALAKGVPEGKLHLFPNWADTETIHPQVDSSSLRIAWGLAPEDKVILYSGNIGEKQGLEIVLDVAEKFLQLSNIKFFLVGSGAAKERLLTAAAQRKLVNIIFKPLLSPKELPAMLNLADLHLVIQREGFGAAVFPSKLANILAAGGYAIVTASQDSELGQLAATHQGIYRLSAPEDAEQLSLAIEAHFQADLIQGNEVARNYALNNLSRDQIIDDFQHSILEKVDGTNPPGT